MFPVYLKVDPAVRGAVLALYPAVEGVSALPIGAYVDRRGRRRAFIFGMFLISVFTFVIGLTNDVFPVAAAHGLSGLAAGMVTISSLTMITDLTVEKNRGTGMGAFDLANLAGYGVGIVLGYFFRTLFAASLGDGFLIVAGIFAAAAFFTFPLLREPAHSSRRQLSLKEMYYNLTGDIIAIFPIWFSITIITGFYFYLPALVPQNVDPGNSAGLIVIGVGVLGAGAVIFGRISDTIGRTKTVAIGAVGEIGFLLLFPNLFEGLVRIPKGQSWIVSLQQIGPLGPISGIFFFLGSALVPSILAFVGDKANKDYRGSAMGLYNIMLSSGIAVGNVLAGIGAQLGGVEAAFYMAAIIFTGLTLTSGYLLQKQHNGDGSPTR
jgi:MFS family permease